MKFHIEAYEIWKRIYVVEADSEAEAVAKFIDTPADKAIEVPNSAVFVECDVDHGMPVDVNTELYDELSEMENAGSYIEDWGIPQISSITEVPEETPAA